MQLEPTWTRYAAIKSWPERDGRDLEPLRSYVSERPFCSMVNSYILMRFGVCSAVESGGREWSTLNARH